MKTTLNMTAVLILALSVLSCNKNNKVSICHIPPGNPANKTNMQVSPAALAAHKAHGDYLGTCTEKVDPCDACYASYQDCLESAGGNKKEMLNCEAAYKKCTELAGPCEPKNPCQECETQHQACIAGAAGDPDILMQCEADYKRCLSLCNGEAPPAQPGGGGGK